MKVIYVPSQKKIFLSNSCRQEGFPVAVYLAADLKTPLTVETYLTVY